MEEIKQEYGIRNALKSFPERDLLVVPHRSGELIVSHPAFGPNNYKGNIAEMQKTYSHNPEFPTISFRPATTSESISAAAYEFSTRAKPEIFDSRWLQAGRIVRTSEGVFANLPTDSEGNSVRGAKILQRTLNEAKKISIGTAHIYLGDNDFGFAPYETFEIGEQDCDTFADGGLARVIEHSEEQAEKLREIASPKNYLWGVYVWGFEPTTQHVSKMLSLGSDGGFGDRRLLVGGNGWYDVRGGYGFGVRRS